MTVDFINLPTWQRRTALNTLSKRAFLRLEARLREIDGHCSWLCDRQREARGLFVPVARNFDFTAVDPPGAFRA